MSLARYLELCAHPQYYGHTIRSAGRILTGLWILSMQDGQALIRMGEQGTKLFLIRKGQVCVMRPSDQKGGPPHTLATLGRGHFVGERTLVTGATQIC